MTWSTGEEYDGGWKNNLQQGQGEHRSGSKREIFARITIYMKFCFWAL